MNKKIKRTGIGLIAAGILILNFSVFAMFHLTGYCPKDEIFSCKDYPMWQWVGRAGVLIIVSGSVALAVYYFSSTSDKK